MEPRGLLQQRKTRKSSYRSLLSRRNLVPSWHATNWLLLPKWRMQALMYWNTFDIKRWVMSTRNVKIRTRSTWQNQYFLSCLQRVCWIKMLLHILISKGDASFFRPSFLMGLYRGGLRPHLMRDLIIALYINKVVWWRLGLYLLNALPHSVLFILLEGGHICWNHGTWSATIFMTTIVLTPSRTWTLWSKIEFSHFPCDVRKSWIWCKSVFEMRSCFIYRDDRDKKS